MSASLKVIELGNIGLGAVILRVNPV